MQQYPDPWRGSDTPREHAERPSSQQDLGQVGNVPSRSAQHGSSTRSDPRQPQPGTRQQQRAFLAGAIVAAIVALVLILQPFGAVGFAGTWVGPITQEVQPGATIPVAELVMTLAQSGNAITGTGHGCFSASTSIVSFDISGTANGTSTHLTLKSSGGTTPVTGTFSGGRLTITTQGQGSPSTITTQQGTLTQFVQACSRLIKIGQAGG
jgi:hypothetical protein